MSADFIARLIGMVVFAILGTYWGTQIGAMATANDVIPTVPIAQYSFTIGLVGALFGLDPDPLFHHPSCPRAACPAGRVSAQTLTAALVGLVVGLLIAALLAFPLSLLPSPFGSIMPFVGVVLFAYLGVAVFVMRQNDIFNLFQQLRPPRGAAKCGIIRRRLGRKPHDPAGYQRDHRRAHRRYCPHRFPARARC